MAKMNKIITVNGLLFLNNLSTLRFSAKVRC